MKKKIITLYVDDELIAEAKLRGLNLSRFMESKLREFILINSPELQNSNFSPPSNIKPIPAFSKHKRDYEKWLIARKLNDGYIKDLERSLAQFVREDMFSLPDNITEMQSVGLRSYLNYLVEKSILTEERAKELKKGIPLRQSNADNYVPNDDEVVNALKKIDDERFKTIFQLLACSGARITELVKMIREYKPSNLIVNEKFAKYQVHYNRGKKKSFYIYIPKELVSKLHKYYVHVNTITHQISKSGLNPKYLRKWFYNFLIYHNVPESIADFIEGRAPETVGAMHYLGKAKQADHWYEQVADELTNIIIA